MPKKEPAKFRGFHPEAFRFFRRLARNNHKPWFDQNRPVYEQHVSGALKGLFEELAPRMLLLDPEFEVSGKTGKNFSRINRDIRFARDKSPYRGNLYLYFGRAGTELGTRLYVGLSADGVTCGFAAYEGRGSEMEDIFKPRRAQQPEEIERLLKRLERRYEMYWHAMERGEWRKHPGRLESDDDWQRCRALIVRRLFPPTRFALRSPHFARQVERIFRELFPLYSFATKKATR
jgi:uncharacterized protein (TIGR02453 family)